MSLETERIMKNLRTQLPGALDKVLQMEFFNTLDDFFQESNIWQEKIPFAVSASDPIDTTYYIEPESVSTIVRISAVTDENGFSYACAMRVPGEVQIARLSDQSGTFTAHVSLSINDPTGKDGFPECPGWVMTKYGIGLIDGVLGKMMMQPAKPYSNLQLAQYHTKKFRNVISVAASESTRSNVVSGQAWRFPQSFATRRR